MGYIILPRAGKSTPSSPCFGIRVRPLYDSPKPHPRRATPIYSKLKSENEDLITDGAGLKTKMSNKIMSQGVIVTSVRIRLDSFNGVSVNLEYMGGYA